MGLGPDSELMSGPPRYVVVCDLEYDVERLLTKNALLKRSCQDLMNVYD